MLGGGEETRLVELLDRGEAVLAHRFGLVGVEPLPERAARLAAHVEHRPEDPRQADLLELLRGCLRLLRRLARGFQVGWRVVGREVRERVELAALLRRQDHRGHVVLVLGHGRRLVRQPSDLVGAHVVSVREHETRVVPFLERGEHGVPGVGSLHPHQHELRDLACRRHLLELLGDRLREPVARVGAGLSVAGLDRDRVVGRERHHEQRRDPDHDGAGDDPAARGGQSPANCLERPPNRAGGALQDAHAPITRFSRYAMHESYLSARCRTPMGPVRRPW